MNAIKHLSPVFFLLIFAACSPRVTYVPTQVAAPMLREKNQVHLSIAPDDAQFAYALTDRWGISVNGNVTTRWLQRALLGDEEPSKEPVMNPTQDTVYRGRRHPGYDADNETRGGQLEVGLVYNYPFKTRGGRNMRLEVMGGYSYGGYRTMDSNFTPHPATPFHKNDYRISNRLHRAFIQGSASLQHGVSEFIFSWRLSAVNFHDMKSGPRAWEQRPENRARFERLDGRIFFLTEPAFTHRIGRRHFQFFYQLRVSGHPVHIDGNDSTLDFDADMNAINQPIERSGPPRMVQAITLNFGLVYRTGSWIKPRTKKAGL